MYVDADVLYAHLNPTDWLKEYAEKALRKERLVTSAITVTELEIIAKRDFDETFSNAVYDDLSELENLDIVPLTESVLRDAAEIRKEHGLNIFDAIHAATAQQENTGIVSSDGMFDTVQGLDRKDPREF